MSCLFNPSLVSKGKVGLVKAKRGRPPKLLSQRRREYHAKTNARYAAVCAVSGAPHLTERTQPAQHALA